MSDCSCVYMSIDDPVDLLSDSLVRARKEHKCSECKKTIEKGEQYKKEITLFEGRFEEYKTCLDCISIRETMFCDGFYYGNLLYDLWDHIEDLNGRISEDCLTQLTPKARETVCNMIEKVWEEMED